ncbi:MAG: hypothetical protein A2V98_04830 [Planctomycetes bacterium RBG_16_64_12]|nr:MAG: hypothetical protein A2V98_04830 [Planctomycetes bacterium RBG_16_64_12]
MLKQRLYLTTAQTGHRLELAGSTLIVRRASSPTAEITVYRDRVNDQPITLRQGEGWRNLGFSALYVTWPAGAGGWVELMVAGHPTDVIGPPEIIAAPMARDVEPEQVVSGAATATTTNDTSLIAAAGAGIKTYLRLVAISNKSAVDTVVAIKDGTTIKQYYPAPANSGAVIPIPAPGLPGTANTAWQFACLDAVTTMYVSAIGAQGV